MISFQKVKFHPWDSCLSGRGFVRVGSVLHHLTNKQNRYLKIPFLFTLSLLSMSPPRRMKSDQSCWAVRFQFMGNRAPQQCTLLARAQRSLGSGVLSPAVSSAREFYLQIPPLTAFFYLLCIQLDSILDRSWASPDQLELLPLVVQCWMAQVLVEELDLTGSESTAFLVVSSALL